MSGFGAYFFTCPNPACRERIRDTSRHNSPLPGRRTECPRCRCYLFPLRPAGEREEVRTRRTTRRLLTVAIPPTAPASKTATLSA